MKWFLILFLLAVLAFCALGFLATLEPMEESSRFNWRLLYGIAGASALGLLAWVATRRGDST